MVKRRAEGEALLRERFERAVSEGDLPLDTDPADVARFVPTFSHGMAVQAAGGATRDELKTSGGYGGIGLADLNQTLKEQMANLPGFLLDRRTA